MSNHKLFCIVGESACGKDTLVKKLCEDTGMSSVISYTTRPRRNGEGETHVFVDDTVYEQMRKENKIAAYTKINGYHYWSTTDQLYANSVYIIDPFGIETLENLGLTDLDLCSIYINVPLEIRVERAQYRGDSMDVFLSRMNSEMEQFIKMKSHGGFDYSISNLNAEKAYNVLKCIVDIETVQN